MVPFLPLSKNKDGFVSSEELGYAYDYMLKPETNTGNQQSSMQGFIDQLESGEGSGFKETESFINTNQNINYRRDESFIMNRNLTKSSMSSYQQKRRRKNKNISRRHHHWYRNRFGEGGYKTDLESRDDLLQKKQQGIWCMCI